MPSINQACHRRLPQRNQPIFLAAKVDLKAVSLVTVDVTGNPLMPLFLAVWQQVWSHPVNLRPKQVAKF
ncbi:hypothetical protein FNJ76_27180 (plasmid) [Escherichia coli]|nr:hypothetical protein FNJ76_27180 [Escherichia coli]RRO68634.1 hypothetical protein AWF59_026275 [Escherichia coli]